MSKLLVRHGVSEANDKSSLAYGSPEANLLPLGTQQATSLGLELVSGFGIVPAEEPVAISCMRRTRQTAQYAGFSTIHEFELLNEATSGLEMWEIHESLTKQQAPRTAIAKAEALLARPLSERVWITHGLVIAGLCEVLGIYKSERFIPRFCEIREIEL